MNARRGAPSLQTSRKGFPMAIEIERKYRVLSLGGLELPRGQEIDQGYLTTNGTTVRVRTKGPKAFLTIKFASRNSRDKGGALERQEFEYEIPVEDAKQLLDQAPYRLTKVRHLLPSGVEVDVFTGRHEGFVLAEYESTDGSQPEPLPGVEWEEVTEDRRYSNSWIARNGVPPLDG